MIGAYARSFVVEFVVEFANAVAVGWPIQHSAEYGEIPWPPLWHLLFCERIAHYSNNRGRE